MPASCRDRHASVSLHPEITGTDSRGAGASAPDGSPLETCLGVLRRSRRRAIPPTLAVEPDHDQRLAEADVAQQAREHWPRAISAGGVFLVHGAAARSSSSCGSVPCSSVDTRASPIGGLRRQSSYPLPCIMPITPSWRPILQINKIHANGRLQGWPEAEPTAGGTPAQRKGQGGLGRQRQVRVWRHLKATAGQWPQHALGKPNIAYRALIRLA